MILPDLRPGAVSVALNCYCGERGTWQVGFVRTCRDHAMAELERLYAEDPRPFTPPLVLPVRATR